MAPRLPIAASSFNGHLQVDLPRTDDATAPHAIDSPSKYSLLDTRPFRKPLGAAGSLLQFKDIDFRQAKVDSNG